MIRKGDMVRFKAEWQDPGDEDVVFVATEDEDGGRVCVEALIGFTVNPRQVVTLEMLCVS